MSSYAFLPDAETYGLVPGAFGLNITAAQIQANLDAASDLFDWYAGARYSLPILPPIPQGLVAEVVHVARYEVLSLRGFDETNSSDKNVVTSYDRAIKRWAEIRNGSLHPTLNESPRPTDLAQPQYAAPLIMSQPLQGWMPGQSCPPNGGPQGIIS